MQNENNQRSQINQHFGTSKEDFLNCWGKLPIRNKAKTRMKQVIVIASQEQIHETLASFWCSC